MRAGRALAAVLLAAALSASTNSGTGQVSAAAAASPNHAAIVVDTGTTVKRLCLAFPEDSISGEEALRRADAIEPLDPVFSDQYGSKGLAVCSLCGVGCDDPSDCFCDPSRYWAYYRAAPGDSAYAYSSRGASTSTVRDGDVEGWKWGKGEPPELTTVGKVCNIDEPPPRTASSGGSTTTTTSEVPTTTSSAPGATTAGGSPAGREAAPSVAGGTSRAGGTGAAGSAAGDAAAGVAVEGTGGGADASSGTGNDGDSSAVALDGQAASRSRAAAEDDAGSGPSPVALAVFAVLLVGLLGWRWRLRRAHP